MSNKRPNFFSFAIVALLVYFILDPRIGLFQDLFKDENMPINQYIENIKNDKVDLVKSTEDGVEIILKDGKTYAINMTPETKASIYQDHLKSKVESGITRYEGTGLPSSNFMNSLLPSIITVAGVGILFYFLLARNNAGNKQAMNFGKSRAKLNQDKNNNITFKDVAGLKEEKEEMSELVDFLRNPKKYFELGARIPKGVLLVGSPGTGKTFIAKAVAGEAGVPFFSISGSSFVELFVGVGASRVRDMFLEAKKNAPCIIFIDEIDAVGRKRGSGLGGGHDEREQTLNQLLVEMDGFEKNEGIIIMAATNRPDILDPALLRPGRFDRTIQIGLPDVEERLEMLKVHTRNKKLAADVDLMDLARSTSGFSPAELENLLNEAALLSARQNLKTITKETIIEATYRVIAGLEKKSKKVIERERKLVAYHEAGHAVVAQFLKDLDPVHLITIVPRGDAGGFTAYLPDEDKSFRTKGEMKNRMVALMGGRAAEEVVLDDISTGASNDIQRTTSIARAMIKTYGMSDILGPVQYEDASGNIFLGGSSYSSGDHYSEETALKIDNEVTRLIKESYQTAKDLVIKHRAFLEELAQTLLVKETIRKDEYLEIARKYDSSLVETKEVLEI